ncbi:MAG: cytochrome b N-terminal domain-containing protein [Pirellulaceae bacterium]
MAFKKLGRTITESQIWRSVFRHGAPTTPRGRSLTIVSNFFLHLHPVTIPQHALRYTFTWGLGGTSFLLYLILVLTGVLLMFYYVPDVNRAYSDMKDLRFAVPFGVFLRNVHRWSAHAMVLTVILHMVRVFYTASYRRPREFNWGVGVILLVSTLLLSFTGYLLPWDQLAYWAITVGTNMARSTPFIGHEGPFHELLGARVDNDIRFVLLGGTVVGQNALLRFYVLHCVAIPAIFSVLLAIHFWRIRKDGGISRPAPAEPADTSAAVVEAVSTPEQPAAPAESSSTRRYRMLAYIPASTLTNKRNVEEREAQVWPSLVWREFLASLGVIIVIWVVSVMFNAPLEEQANSAVTPNPAKAPWYFDGLQELLVYFEPWIAGVALPTIIVFGLMAIPYLDTNTLGVGEYAFSKRRFAVSVFTFGMVLWFVLIFIGLFIRGPSWAWYWPWEDWSVAKETTSTTWNLTPFAGGALLATYFGAGLILPAFIWPSFHKALGTTRYAVTMLLLLMMMGVPIKMGLRLALNIKYVLITPWFNI